MSIAINSGNSGSVAQRFMNNNDIGNNDKLNYNLYINPSYTLSNVWGDDTEGTMSVFDFGSGEENAFPIYGKLDLNQYIKPGIYTDNLTVTLFY